MQSFKPIFAYLAVIISALSLIGSSVVASPLVTTDLESRKASAVQAAPHFVTYTDQWISGENGPPNVSAVKVLGHILFRELSTHI
jgi:hypothetical protein